MENTQRTVRWMGLITLALGLATAGYEVNRWYKNPSPEKVLTYEEARIENAHTALEFAGLFFAFGGALVVYAAFSGPSRRHVPYRKELGIR